MMGGAIGAAARYLLQVWLTPRLEASKIPLSIFIINVVGSFGLGLFFPFTKAVEITAQLFVATGFFGAFTTFSTFSMESVTVYKQYGLKYSLVFVLLSIGSCLIFFWIGNYISELV